MSLHGILLIVVLNLSVVIRLRRVLQSVAMDESIATEDDPLELVVVTAAMGYGDVIDTGTIIRPGQHERYLTENTVNYIHTILLELVSPNRERVQIPVNHEVPG